MEAADEELMSEETRIEWLAVNDSVALLRLSGRQGQQREKETCAIYLVMATLKLDVTLESDARVPKKTIVKRMIGDNPGRPMLESDLFNTLPLWMRCNNVQEVVDIAEVLP